MYGKKMALSRMRIRSFLEESYGKDRYWIEDFLNIAEPWRKFNQTFCSELISAVSWSVGLFLYFGNYMANVVYDFTYVEYSLIVTRDRRLIREYNTGNVKEAIKFASIMATFKKCY
jgi:hypothetical protein